MKIVLEAVGRRFNRQWIFRRLNYTFEKNHSYAILGFNGSGKSTLLQIISGILSPSEGKVSYQLLDQEVGAENIYTHLSIAAPYLELIEEFTLQELLEFHFRFKNPLNKLTIPDLIQLLNMENNKHKELKYFSSGMKQRVKLILAVCSDVPILLLDEPTSNLDEEGINWYKNLMSNYRMGRITIICSNQPYEYDFCDHILKLSDYKIQ